MTTRIGPFTFTSATLRKVLPKYFDTSISPSPLVGALALLQPPAPAAAEARHSSGLRKAIRRHCVRVIRSTARQPSPSGGICRPSGKSAVVACSITSTCTGAAIGGREQLELEVSNFRSFGPLAPPAGFSFAVMSPPWLRLRVYPTCVGGGSGL